MASHVGLKENTRATPSRLSIEPIQTNSTWGERFRAVLRGREIEVDAVPTQEPTRRKYQIGLAEGSKTYTLFIHKKARSGIKVIDHHFVELLKDESLLEAIERDIGRTYDKAIAWLFPQIWARTVVIPSPQSRVSTERIPSEADGYRYRITVKRGLHGGLSKIFLATLCNATDEERKKHFANVPEGVKVKMLHISGGSEHDHAYIFVKQGESLEDVIKETIYKMYEELGFFRSLVDGLLPKSYTREWN